MKRYIYIRFLQPHSLDQDTKRREFILNVLLLGLSIVAIAAILVTTASFIFGRVINGSASIIGAVVFLLIMLALRRMVRAGWYYLSTYSLLAIISLLYLWLSWQWSFELPMTSLIFTVILVMSGVLLTARAALRFDAIIITLYLLFSYLQVIKVLNPDIGWIKQPITTGDVVGYGIVFSAISLISWLANREIDRSLLRARISESALSAERDSLEVKVSERTKALEQMQLVRLMELQRFAEFGRFSANLLHEVGNPVTAASLNLEQVRHHPQSKLVLQAQKSLQHLERYLAAARKQLMGQSELATFSIHRELNQLIDILSPNAMSGGVTIELQEAAAYRLYGDAVKFNQLLSNLILNAIEAYNNHKHTSPKPKLIAISVAKQSQKITITVQDWGKGISSEALPHIFEPFYSSKPESNRSMGIGLAMVRQFVEQDFHGTIKVTSSTATGTKFIVVINDKPTVRS